MKIAVASIKGLISEHFGHSDSFEVFTVENKMPIFVESIKNPEHKHGYLPVFLKSAGIDVVICGNIGQSAVQLMVGEGMDVFSGAKGSIEDVIEQYAQGLLVSQDLGCSGHNHDHDHECHHD
ncbi:MAG: NifB/NifX family molybdenum-iron cluster-binding protein [Firmicutes bacterium]|nr:NifB/NifX family molybdenum-iron cluster-binding protein [Bacillota bacterium]